MSDILPEGTQVSLPDGRNFTVRWVSNMVATDSRGQTYRAESAKPDSMTHAVPTNSLDAYCGRRVLPHWSVYDPRQVPIDCKRCRALVTPPA